MAYNVIKFFKIIIFFTMFLFGSLLIIKNVNILKNFNQIKLPSKQLDYNNKIKHPTNVKLTKKKDSKELIKLSDVQKVVIVKKNDTFSTILKPYIKESNFRYKVINAINKKFDLKNLRINQKIIFSLNKNNNAKKIIIPIDFYSELIIELDQDKINIYIQKIEFIREINALEFMINSSLYKDGIKAGLPLIILINAIKLYSFDLDFQRDIKKNTIFQISYEKLFNKKRNEISYGNIEYINLIIEKKKIEYFIFKTDDGFLSYFNEDGKNVKKSLLKTPIDGAKLTSSFGLRKHPISGFNKLHKGVDFAAPTGTPIYAGGNGVIEYVGRNGGYGKYIRIRHPNGYKTAYAHLSNFKKEINKGKRVNQGEIIGYVGTTGKSTGPHLHYEILYQNKQINPMEMKLPSGRILKDKELRRFKKNAKNIYAEYLSILYE